MIKTYDKDIYIYIYFCFALSLSLCLPLSFYLSSYKVMKPEK